MSEIFQHTLDGGRIEISHLGFDIQKTFDRLWQDIDNLPWSPDEVRLIRFEEGKAVAIFGRDISQARQILIAGITPKGYLSRQQLLLSEVDERIVALRMSIQKGWGQIWEQDFNIFVPWEKVDTQKENLQFTIACFVFDVDFESLAEEFAARIISPEERIKLLKKWGL